MWKLKEHSDGNMALLQEFHQPSGRPGNPTTTMRNSTLVVKTVFKSMGLVFGTTFGVCLVTVETDETSLPQLLQPRFRTCAAYVKMILSMNVHHAPKTLRRLAVQELAFATLDSTHTEVAPH